MSTTISKTDYKTNNTYNDREYDNDNNNYKSSNKHKSKSEVIDLEEVLYYEQNKNSDAKIGGVIKPYTIYLNENIVKVAKKKNRNYDIIIIISVLVTVTIVSIALYILYMEKEEHVNIFLY